MVYFKGEKMKYGNVEFDLEDTKQLVKDSGMEPEYVVLFILDDDI